MASKRMFGDWLTELKELAHTGLKKRLDELPEFDIVDARGYYKDGLAPAIYYDECLAEHSDEGLGIEEIMAIHKE